MGCRFKMGKRFSRSIPLTKLGFMTCLPMVHDGIRLVEILYTENFLNMNRQKLGANKRARAPIKRAERQ